MRRVAFLHRLVGLTTVIVFLGTGGYMKLYLPPPDVSTHLTRMLFRSAHVYLLLSGLINISIGAYLVRAPSARRRTLQAAASVLLLLAPAIVLFAFFYEPPRASLDRPVTLAAVISMLAGTTLHLLAGKRASGILSTEAEN